MLFPSTCFCCGAYFQLHLGLCPYCIDKVIQPQSQMQHIRHLWMATWTDQKHAWMSKWARSFKGNQPDLWENAAIATASSFLCRQPLYLPRNSRQIYVIDPAQKQDHSFWYAHHLARILSAQHLPLFFVKNSATPPQKELGLTARRTQKQQYMIRDERGWAETQEKRDILWLFVDDVVTSGATWQACYQLLARPPAFCIISWLKRGTTSFA